MKLVLASTSPYRALLLERLGVPFTAAAPLCDEDALKDPRVPLDHQALQLARAKARSLAPLHPDAHVLGGDQIADLDGEMLSKPLTRENAIAQLQRLRGRTHRLWTAIVLRAPDGDEQAHIDLHTITMRSLSDDELARYVDADRPLDCAGSYKIEGRGIALIEQIDGADFTAITGMSLIALTTMLRARGFSVP
ncbi:MAG TPA: nucleoside triphosphate pyrophosphatase [Polyangiales bacterium]|nr:nucleoside triphosphate pyrophosphatase [Polyangiales bacterium]